MAKQGIKRRVGSRSMMPAGSAGRRIWMCCNLWSQKLLLALGEKPGRNGLLKTPERVAKASPHDPGLSSRHRSSPERCTVPD